MLLWRDAVVEGSVFREWIVNTGRRTASARIAHLFCELFVRMDDVGLTSNRSYRLPITQAVLADATGLSMVHVNRSLQHLRHEGLISFKGGSLTIHDWDGLVEAAGFDPAYLNLGKNHKAPSGFSSRLANGLRNGGGDHPPAGDAG